jgi:hypothetical protein
MEEAKGVQRAGTHALVNKYPPVQNRAQGIGYIAKNMAHIFILCPFQRYFGPCRCCRRGHAS